MSRDEVLTEADWLGCSNPLPMLEFLRDHRRVQRRKRGRRKLRLFAVACCRRVSKVFKDDRGLTAVDLGERYADDEATQEKLTALREALWVAATNRPWACACNALMDVNWEAAYCTALNAYFSTVYARGGSKRERERKEKEEQCRLLRDIFGNPFRPVALDPSWRTPAAVRLARTLYGERAFDRLPKLAHVLEESGCDDEDILGHCRGPGPHTRGCWLLDLFLDRF